MGKRSDREPEILQKLRQFQAEAENLAQESEQLHSEHSMLKTKIVRLAHDLLHLLEEVRQKCGDCLQRMQHLKVQLKRRHDDE